MSLVLEELISDPHPMVRRKAAESYLRISKKPPIEKIIAMLGSEDRHEVSVARRLLERMPEDAFKRLVVALRNRFNVFVHGSIALMSQVSSIGDIL